MVVLHWHSKEEGSPVRTDRGEKRMCSASRLPKVAWKSIKTPKERGTRAGCFICICSHWT